VIESFVSIIVCGVATFLANYLSTKPTKLSVEVKERLVKSLFILTCAFLAVFAVYSTILLVTGLLGMVGVHGWSFSLYGIDREDIFHKGLVFTGRLEPVWFIVRGIVGLLFCIFLGKLTMRIRKQNKQSKYGKSI